MSGKVEGFNTKQNENTPDKFKKYLTTALIPDGATKLENPDFVLASLSPSMIPLKGASTFAVSNS